MPPLARILTFAVLLFGLSLITLVLGPMFIVLPGFLFIGLFLVTVPLLHRRR